MSRAAIARRLAALEAGPSNLKTFEDWATVHGWAQVHAWEKTGARRVMAKLMPLPGDEPAPEETPLERQFHEAMAAATAANPQLGTMAWLREKLGLPQVEE